MECSVPVEAGSPQRPSPKIQYLFVVAHIPKGGWNARIEYGVFYNEEEAKLFNATLTFPARIHKRKGICINGQWHYLSAPIRNLQGTNGRPKPEAHRAAKAPSESHEEGPEAQAARSPEPGGSGEWLRELGTADEQREAVRPGSTGSESQSQVNAGAV